MIHVYFVQHGIALSKDIDETRALSDVGSKATRKMATHLKVQNISIRKIVHSGKLRALQTAAIFAEILEANTVSEFKGMKPNDDPDELIEQMTEDAVMYIGHLPNIEKVVSSLVADNGDSGVLKFQNSAVACVEINDDEKYIKWFLTPDLCP